MIELRDYQHKIIESIRGSFKDGNKRILMTAPTGAGKTVTFVFMVSEHLKRGGRVLILTHRTELVNQTDRTFSNFGLEPDFITAGSKPDLSKSLHVAMIETIYKRAEDYKTFIESRTMIITDECHLTTFDKLFPYFSESTLVIGATATPLRVGKQDGLDTFYNSMVQEIDTPKLINDGFLCNVHTYGQLMETKGLKKVGEDYDTKKYYEENKTYKGVVDNYLRLVAGKKTIVFASNIESSKQVCEEFKQHGIEARHIDGTTSENERIDTLNWFKTTPTAVICNCGILTAGYDEPTVEVIILYRATTSLPLYLQMVGRGSRKSIGKEFFYLLDFGNNVARFDFWESPRYWNLSKPIKPEKIQASPIKECTNCSALVSNKALSCEYCGFAFPAKEKYDKDEVKELMLLPKPDLMRKSDLIEKVKLVKSGALKAWYVLHNMTDASEAYEFCKLMGYKDGFIHENKHRFKVFQ